MCCAGTAAGACARPAQAPGACRSTCSQSAGGLGSSLQGGLQPARIRGAASAIAAGMFSMKHLPQALCWIAVCTVMILHISDACVHARHQVARIDAAGNQAVDTALTALRQQICKAMESITNQVLPWTHACVLHLCTVLSEILLALLGKYPQLSNISYDAGQKSPCKRTGHGRRQRPA